MLLAGTEKFEVALTMSKLDADQKLYDAYGHRKPTKRPHLFYRFPGIIYHVR
jgi:hypothetical protein